MNFEKHLDNSKNKRTQTLIFKNATKESELAENANDINKGVFEPKLNELKLKAGEQATKAKGMAVRVAQSLQSKLQELKNEVKKPKKDTENKHEEGQ